MDVDEIVEKARSLRPWHFDFEIVPGVKARSLNDPEVAEPDHKGVGVVDPTGMDHFYKSYWPQGLAGKDVLDAACNAGAYCFKAHEFGARSATGFDVRKHWIDQAEFIRNLKYPDAENVQFEIADAKAFLSRTPRSFDITIFKGILYHLPDPIGVLLDFCNATRETLLVDTASSDTVPEDCLAPIMESKTHVMSGVDGLAWMPGGPAAVRRIMEYAGFRRFEVVFWRHGDRPGFGRFQLIGSRQP